MTELTHRLSSKITHMPTCAVAEFTFVAKSSSNIGKAKPAKVALDYPKKLSAGLSNSRKCSLGFPGC